MLCFKSAFIDFYNNCILHTEQIAVGSKPREMRSILVWLIEIWYLLPNSMSVASTRWAGGMVGISKTQNASAACLGLTDLLPLWALNYNNKRFESAVWHVKPTIHSGFFLSSKYWHNGDLSIKQGLPGLSLKGVQEEQGLAERSCSFLAVSWWKWTVAGLSQGWNEKKPLQEHKRQEINGKNCVAVVIDFRALFIREVNADYNSSQQAMPTKMLSGLAWLLSVLRMAMQTWGSADCAFRFWKAPCTRWKCWYFMPMCISPFEPSLLCILSYYWYFLCLPIPCHMPSSTATILYLIKLWRKGKSLFSKCHRGKRSWK